VVAAAPMAEAARPAPTPPPLLKTEPHPGLLKGLLNGIV